MVKLLAPLNHRGGIIEAGAIIGFLGKEKEEQLVSAGSAEEYILETDENLNLPENPLAKMTKDELLIIVADLKTRLAEKPEQFETLKIKDISDANVKAEIREAVKEAQEALKKTQE